MSNNTELLLDLLSMERQWWSLGRQILDKYNIDIQDLADLPFIALIVRYGGFPLDITDGELEPIYAAFDADDWQPCEMLAWLRGEAARLLCLREISALTSPLSEQESLLKWHEKWGLNAAPISSAGPSDDAR